MSYIKTNSYYYGIGASYYGRYYDRKISTIIFGGDVTHIPDYMCYTLKALKKVEMPNNILSIGKYSFYECYDLKEIELSNNLKTIGDQAFRDCRSLSQIVIPESVDSILSYAFYGCRLTTITIGSNVKYIGCDAFSGQNTSGTVYYCKAITPPTLWSPTDEMLGNVNNVTAIYVPRQSVEEYRVLWSTYASKILGYDF